MRGVIRFKPGLSDEYKDLVNLILKYECAERIPLIKVFDHPWVKNFEKKYNLSKAPVVVPPKSDKSKRPASSTAASSKEEKKSGETPGSKAASAQAAAIAEMAVL